MTIHHYKKHIYNIMNSWQLTYESFDPKQEGLREALCALGNGYFVTRGAAEDSVADKVHYPGTYLGGGYNRLVSKIHGRPIENEDLVNFPNWLPLTFRIEQGPWFRTRKTKFDFYRQTLDLQHGILIREMEWSDSKGRRTRLKTERLVSMQEAHFAAIRWEFTPLNWSGKVTFRSQLDGSVQNTGVARYNQLASKHLEVLKLGSLNHHFFELLAQTKQSHIRMAQACRTQIREKEKDWECKIRTCRSPEKIGKDFTGQVQAKKTYRIEKLVSLYTSRDRGITEPSLNARMAIMEAPSFATLRRRHCRQWRYLWEHASMELQGKKRQEQVLKLHLFHLIQTVSPNTIGQDVGVPARGLHGEAYRGHIFWDELFIFPIFNFSIPDITRSLLLYRYYRLPMARLLARKNGFKGAMYPWQSGSDGREETQQMHLNPQSGRWLEDNSHRQRHVNLAIAYNIWQYFRTTGDKDFLEEFGAEVFLEIARFWESITHFNKQRSRFEIHGVMGPDEYHDGYPHSKEKGLRNNAYTNVMVVWLLGRALEMIEELHTIRREKLFHDLEITPQEFKRWEKITKRMYVPFSGDGIISQFEGYEKLKEFNWEAYRSKYNNIERLDRLLEAEGDSTNFYKVSKQADVCMLFYLLPYHRLKTIFSQLDYNFDSAMMRENISYYLSRTSHGSTLSKIVHASILNRIDRRQGWNLFNMALESDISDVQGGTTPEGIHLGAMAGTVEIAFRDFAGLDVQMERLYFYPQLPKGLAAFKFNLKFRDHWLKLHITQKSFTLRVEKVGHQRVKIQIRNDQFTLSPGDTIQVAL